MLVRLLILNNNDTVLDELKGIINYGSLTIDGTSSVRRTYNFTMCPSAGGDNWHNKAAMWLNRRCMLQIGIKTSRMTSYRWYSQGCFYITDSSFTYDRENNSLSINCKDMYIGLDGTTNGVMGQQTIRLPAYEEDEAGNPVKYNTINEILVTLMKLGNISKYHISADIGEAKGMRKNNINYQIYRQENPRWNCLPYDLEYSCGTSLSQIMNEVINLYPGYDASFNEEGVFVVQEIPTCNGDLAAVDNDMLQSCLLSESTTTDYTPVRNICEVWGKSYEADYYTEDCTTSNGTYITAIEGYDDYFMGCIVAIRLDSSNTSGQLLNINNLGSAAIYDENTEKPIAAGVCLANEIYCFKCKKSYIDGTYVNKFYLLGQWQPHALNVLTDGTVIKDGYSATDGTLLDMYSKKYFQEIYNCNNVNFTVVPDSIFTVQKIGERISVKSGNEYDNITSTSLAAARAEYENWKNSRLTDNITITLNTVIPWIQENMKIAYIRKGETVKKEYITQSVSINLSEATTTITMYTFYPLYESDSGTRGTHEVLSQYQHYSLSDFNNLEMKNIVSAELRINIGKESS